MSEAGTTKDVASLTVQLLSAYLANNTVASEELAGLIRSTRDALTSEPAPTAQARPETFTPAVSVRKSLASPENIISLIDGKPYKTLKRHLAGYGLTPQSYRSRYNLSSSYPMVAPAYAERRRVVAQQSGLGRRKAVPSAAAQTNEKVVTNTGAAEGELTQSQLTEASTIPAPKRKPGRPKAAKKSADAPLVETGSHQDAASAPTRNTFAAAASTSSEASGAANARFDAIEASVVSEDFAPVAVKKRAANPVIPKAVGRPSGKAETQAGAEAKGKLETGDEASSGSRFAAKDKRDAQVASHKRQRRAKLSVFKTSNANTDGAANRTVAESADALLDAQDPVDAAPLVETRVSAMRKSPKRNSRSTEASRDTQSDRSAASDNTPNE
jgi:predicted transcriptional regulator